MNSLTSCYKTNTARDKKKGFTLPIAETTFHENPFPFAQSNHHPSFSIKKKIVL